MSRRLKNESNVVVRASCRIGAAAAAMMAGQGAPAAGHNGSNKEATGRIAEAVCYLASAGAGLMTGGIIDVTRVS